MWPFNRNKKPTDTKTPPEVKQYYTSEHRERVGLAWLIAFLSLIITMVVVIGLFFGGRWAYRKIANNKPVTPAKPQTVAKQPAKPNQTVSEPAKPGNDSTSQKPASSSSYTPTTSTPAPAQSQSTATTPVTSQPQAQKITNTGPGQTIAVFAVVSLIGAIAHNTYSRRKLSVQN